LIHLVLQYHHLCCLPLPLAKSLCNLVFSQYLFW
jgi:hypothetical protein